MIKIALASDLHLEFAPIELYNTENADVLILAGDICEAHYFEKRIGFFEQVAKEFPNVIYIMGNHEHYNYDFKYTMTDIKKHLAHLTNVYPLDKECIKINDYMFIGGTLWTDMNKEDSLTMFHTGQRMNDYRLIRNSNRMSNRVVPIYQKNPLYTTDGQNGCKYDLDEKGYHIKIAVKHVEEPSKLSVEDTMNDHYKMIEYIKHVVSEGNDKCVVVGHHAPSKSSTKPRYIHDTLMNGAYSSELSDFILDRPSIKLWVHGHTHDTFDYMIGSTRIVCNPRGYDGYEKSADNFKLQYISLGD